MNMNMGVKRVRWVEPPATNIDEAVIKTPIQKTDSPVKPILKVPRKKSFPFSSEEDNKNVEYQEGLNKTEEIPGLLRDYFICVMKNVFRIIKMLFNNQIVVGFTNFLISVIAFIAITALRTIATVGKFLIDFNFSLFFESCVFLLEEHEIYFTTDLSLKRSNCKFNKKHGTTTTDK